MTLAFSAIVFGLVVLVWSADRFVEGSASAAGHYGMPPLLIGMVIVGFGTSAPEMVVSALASLQGNPGIALGNAYGSNITNIALVLGLAALIAPITVHSQVLRKELPLLVLVTILAAWQLRDGIVTRVEAVLLLGVFSGLMGWTIWQGLRSKRDALGEEIEHELEERAMPLGRALFWIAAGTCAAHRQFEAACLGCSGDCPPLRGKRPDNRIDRNCGGHLAAGTGSHDHRRPQGRTRYRPGQCTGVEPVQHPGRRGDCRDYCTSERRPGSIDARYLGDGGPHPVALCPRNRSRRQAGAHQPTGSRPAWWRATWAIPPTW